VPSWEGILAPPGKYNWTYASFGPPKSTTKWQIDLFCHFCTAHDTVLSGMPFTPNNCPFAWVSGPHLIHASLGPAESITQMSSGSIQSFLHSPQQSVAILYNGLPLPPQNCLFCGGCGPHLIHCSCSPPESSTQTASWSFRPFLQGSLVRQTDRPHCLVGYYRLHLYTQYHSLMRPNNAVTCAALVFLICDYMQTARMVTQK